MLKDKRQSRAVSTSTQSSQTLPSQYQITRQISHSDLQQLQLDTNSSDTTMRILATFMRRATGVNRLIEPNYKHHLVDLHTIFTDIYEVIIYHPPGADSFGVPLVICSHTSTLLHRLADYHHREVRIVHHGCDSGKGFLKFNQRKWFAHPTTRTYNTSVTR